MKTLSLNSKKCLTAKALLWTTLVLTIASTTTAAWAAGVPSQIALVKDMNSNPQSDFNVLLVGWQSSYGVAAVGPLLAIAKDTRNSDRQRYIAIMGASRLGGPVVAEKLVPLLKDKVWLIRSGTLRALAALQDKKAGPAVLPLLKDPALVVRAEAVETVKILKPAGSAQALLAVLHSQDNYRFGKAQWVPQRALAALVVLQDRSVVTELEPLLDHKKDPELQRQTLFVLQTLTGIEGNSKLPLDGQIAAWKKNLAQNHRPSGDSLSTSAAHSEPALRSKN